MRGLAPGTGGLAALAVGLIAAGAAGAALWPGAASAAVGLSSGAAGLGLLLFLRDPDRAIPAAAEGLILAPADGRVVDVARVREEIFLAGPALRISVFLGVLDVHVNRAPVAGTVALVRHEPGRFLQAFRPEAARQNERNLIGLDGDGRRTLVVQIAGILARRIDCWVRPGESVVTGQRLGMIRFGSRVEICVPEPCEPLVRIGQRVWGGQTPMARSMDD
jgi:phosphatidylserine decarboxylase